MKKVLAWMGRHWIITSLLAAFLILGFIASDMLLAIVLISLAIDLLIAYLIYKLLRRKLDWPNRHPKKTFALAFVLVKILGILLELIFFPDDALRQAINVELGVD